MFSESVFDSVFCLADILSATRATCDGIDQIVSVTIDLGLTMVFQSCGVAGNSARLIQLWTVSAGGAITRVL